MASTQAALATNRRRLATLPLAAALLAGCTILGAPDRPPIDAVYVNQLDAADSLVFRDDFTGERRGVALVGSAAAPETVAVRRQFTYQPVGADFHVTLVCPPNANCVAGPHYRARLDGAELRLEPLFTESSEPALRFRRVPR